MIHFSFLEVLLFLISLIIFISLFFLKNPVTCNFIFFKFIKLILYSIFNHFSIWNLQLWFYCLFFSASSYLWWLTFFHGRAWQPTPVFLPGESYRQRSLAGCKSMVLQRVWYDWSDLAHTHDLILWACICWNVSVVILEGLG